MRRLYVELEIPDEVDDSDPVDAACLVLSGGTANVLSARWYPIVEVDGGEHCATLAEALERATHKVSFTLHTGERVRLLRYGGAFVLSSFAEELREALAAEGVPDEVLAALTDDG